MEINNLIILLSFHIQGNMPIYKMTTISANTKGAGLTAFAGKALIKSGVNPLKMA